MCLNHERFKVDCQQDPRRYNTFPRSTGASLHLPPRIEQLERRSIYAQKIFKNQHSYNPLHLLNQYHDRIKRLKSWQVDTTSQHSQPSRQSIHPSQSVTPSHSSPHPSLSPSGMQTNDPRYAPQYPRPPATRPPPPHAQQRPMMPMPSQSMPAHNSPPQTMRPVPSMQQPNSVQTMRPNMQSAPNARPLPPNARPTPPSARPMQPTTHPTPPNARPMPPNARPMPPNAHPMPPQHQTPPPNGHMRPAPHYQSQSQQQSYAPPPTNAMQNPPRPVNMRPMPAPPSARPLPPGYAGASVQPPNGQPPQQYPPQEDPHQNKLSSSQMPRPCALEKPCGAPRERYSRSLPTDASATGAPILPSANSDFISIDDGSARLRFMRLTTNAIASEPSKMSKSGVPLAVVMTPFANTVPGEAPVPVVDFSSKQVGGPLRCERCNGYANPGFKFLAGGSQFQCNLCNHINTTPTEHFSPISPSTGQRMDAETRHELRFGSVDYLVGSPDYCIRPPRPASYIFAVDVSTAAINSGFASAAMMSIKSAIGANLLPGSKEGARVGLITFDSALHFFDARGSENGKSVSTQYVPDIMDPFIPLGGNALFLTPAQAVLAVDTAIENHGLAQGTRNPQNNTVGATESCLGSALQALKLAFADCGGKAFVFAGTLPAIGLSKLERRGGGAIGGGEEREMGLLKEAIPNYEILGCELAEVQASVDLFLAPSSVYIDASTLCRVPRACGGRMHLFTGFDPIRDGASLHRSICAAASGARAFESLVRVRTSPGLEARGEYIGSFGRPQRGDDVSGPVLDSSSTLALEISVVSKLLDDEKNNNNRAYAGTASLYDDACVQCAVLFTDAAGRRRIRVHTVFATKSSVLSEVFKHADVDAIASFLAKKAAAAVLIGGTSFSKACEALTEKTAQALYIYRKYCTSSSLSGQLILPEAMKVLPVMMLGLTKSAGFRRAAVSTQAGDAVTVDERAATLSFLTSGTVAEVSVMCYPRMWELQKLVDGAGLPTGESAIPVVNSIGENGVKEKSNIMEPIALPNTMVLSAESLSDERILLIENGMQMVVWLGSRVEKSAAEDVVAQIGAGRYAIRGETAGSEALIKNVSERGKRVARIIQRITSERHRLSRPQVVLRAVAGSGGEAKFVMPLLIEDRGNGSHSYVEYLRHVHKRVMDKMANDSAQNDMQTWEMLNHGY